MKRRGPSMLDAWYGPERAQRMRRHRMTGGDVRGFAEPPSQQTVTQLDPTMKAVLQARMQLAMNALKAGHAAAVQTAQSWPELNWKTGVLAASMPFLAPIIGAVTVQSDVKGAVLSALRSTMATQISMREADMSRVLSGSLSVEVWMTSVRETAKGIASILNGLREGTVASNMLDRISDTFTDISSGITWLGQKVREVPQNVDKYGAYYVAGAALLGAFILYQYATAPLKLLPQSTRREG